jgi:hypothetical protein
MAINGTQTQRTEKAYDFTPVDFDGETVEPEAASGHYEATIEEVKVSKTKPEKGAFPMLIIEWKLTATDSDDEKCQQSVEKGATLADFLTFFPEGDKRGRMGKQRFRKLNERLGIDNDILPKRLQTKADFDDYKAALQGQTMEVWVTASTDEASGETRTSVNYTAPKGSAASNVEVEEEPETPRKGPTKAAKKTARR